MKKLSTIKVTKFNSLKATKEYSNITMFEELNHIKNGTYKSKVTDCREALKQGDKELYTKLKSTLPAVTFCGEFNGRKTSEIVEYNNLMILDIDDLTQEEFFNIKKVLSNDKYILSLWDSPSGKGLKCLIRINSSIDKHKLIFNSLELYFLENYQIILDKSGKDISRLCFSSWDENIYYNPSSEIYSNIIDSKIEKNKKTTVLKPVTLTKSAYATEGLNKKSDRFIMKKIIEYLIKKNLSITSNYNSWVNVALGISYSFSYDVGEKYFLSLCRLDLQKHNEEKSIILLQNCYNNRKINSNEIITFATIIFLAKENGFVLKPIKK
ncbi:BT4734/BF3469 family protein [Flavobacterium collinsii]|uniref:VirE_N domain-containing protein n=1 Tax=Flavobacterium collinsii TaxID=1114861 RepID=A0A9W4X520_9FLAO|nr:BT4734/BF3469 family protein [Flavobacterium collinsii]CAI2769084.1 VirE_N domain-containing protein [Flavobacterium collinsii]